MSFSSHETDASATADTGTDLALLRYSVVVPTVGRSGLRRVLDALAHQQATEDERPAGVIVVDDRPTPHDPLDLSEFEADLPLRIVLGHGRGPAHARNRGWRLTTTPWVAFLDDDVEPAPTWCTELVRDLRACEAGTAATAARLRVPVPSHRRPTDWERNTAGLAQARWATADMAFLRSALVDVHGFDERFPRAFREDADLALRLRRAGWRLAVGDRVMVHPVREADMWVSARVQAGNADDALMRRLHGPTWHDDAEAPAGWFARHVATVVAGAAGLIARATAAGLASSEGPKARQAARFLRRIGLAGVLAWVAATAAFFAHRMRPGPRPGDDGYGREVATMAATSVLIPPLAVTHRVRGALTHHDAEPWPPAPRAILFDRDGTLVHDVPYNTRPEAVRPVASATHALTAARKAGLALGVVSNQSAIGRGLATARQVDAVDERVWELLGPFDTWQRCPHAPEDGCPCRKPAAGLVEAALCELGLEPWECVVIGDIGADVEAALAAGATPILVPTAETRVEEVADAPFVASTLADAVDLALDLTRPALGPEIATPPPPAPAHPAVVGEGESVDESAGESG
ncbi:HAD-IIIA family hydrolase [Mobilicoccus massiliensis]|uniref:HAD-IIIA family hydrolase n=1 Tax=Mobilicoccus massiliensis TaxID=1522310 RepID=UPI0009E3E84C|nr:HAD-IIIA family hydrolase [Mobilicoccus massiliensis]